MYLFIKRVGDIVLSLVGIIILSPAFLLLAAFIKFDSAGPVIFCQKRIGKGKSHFMLYKFRTMRIDAPKALPTHMLKSPEKYITKTGRFMRRTSLDELPQLLNILKGDMSIIGPRPALWNQYDLVEERDKYGANDLPPGLTGWAQINGRDELPIPEKARLDGIYVARIGFLFDCEIFFRTVMVAVSGKGYAA